MGLIRNLFFGKTVNPQTENSYNRVKGYINNFLAYITNIRRSKKLTFERVQDEYAAIITILTTHVNLFVLKTLSRNDSTQIRKKLEEIKSDVDVLMGYGNPKWDKELKKMDAHLRRMIGSLS